jgi:hypothetical protein
MDDSGFIIVCFVFWLVVNPTVGYLIGKRKNNADGGLVLGLLLGPIGWLIAAVYTGNLRKCPFCSEDIKPDAKVCRYCGREVTPVVAPQPFPESMRKKFVTDVLILVVVALVLIVLMLWYAGFKSHRHAQRNASPSLRCASAIKIVRP